MNKTKHKLPAIAYGSTYLTEYVNGVRVRRDWETMTATVTLDQWTVVCSLTDDKKINQAILTLINKRAAYFAKAKRNA
jgi:hypothetical protein